MEVDRKPFTSFPSSVQKKKMNSADSSNRSKIRRPDIQLYVPRGRRSGHLVETVPEKVGNTLNEDRRNSLTEVTDRNRRRNSERKINLDVENQIADGGLGSGGNRNKETVSTVHSTEVMCERVGDVRYEKNTKVICEKVGDVHHGKLREVIREEVGDVRNKKHTAVISEEVGDERNEKLREDISEEVGDVRNKKHTDVISEEVGDVNSNSGGGTQLDLKFSEDRLVVKCDFSISNSLHLVEEVSDVVTLCDNVSKNNSFKSLTVEGIDIIQAVPVDDITTESDNNAKVSQPKKTNNQLTTDIEFNLNNSGVQENLKTFNTNDVISVPKPERGTTLVTNVERKQNKYDRSGGMGEQKPNSGVSVVGGTYKGEQKPNAHNRSVLVRTSGGCYVDDSTDCSEDSWDVLFDDSGDHLDQDILQELTKQVGDVTVEKAKLDYLSWTPKEYEIDDSEFGHIIELYDFPVEFKTQDIMAAFRDIRGNYFDIKWVDDTHALAIFSSQMTAQEALSISYSNIKVRPLSQATPMSRNKARKAREFMQPYKPRPATSASLARRLVTGALGLRVQVPKEQRDLERQKLKDAKEKRRLAVKQREDAWNGVID